MAICVLFPTLKVLILIKSLFFAKLLCDYVATFMDEAKQVEICPFFGAFYDILRRVESNSAALVLLKIIWNNEVLRDLTKILVM
jgi:hypothetical protein